MQSRKKLIEQSKEIKQNRKLPKNIDICFCLLFCRYDQTFTSGRQTEHWALLRPNFEIFPKFLRFLRPSTSRIH